MDRVTSWPVGHCTMYLRHVARCRRGSIGTVSVNSVESDLGCTSRIYFDNMMPMLHNVTLMAQEPCKHNNKCDYSKIKFMFFNHSVIRSLNIVFISAHRVDPG